MIKALDFVYLCTVFRNLQFQMHSKEHGEKESRYIKKPWDTMQCTNRCLQSTSWRFSTWLFHSHSGQVVHTRAWY